MFNQHYRQQCDTLENKEKQNLKRRLHADDERIYVRVIDLYNVYFPVFINGVHIRICDTICFK